MLGLGQGLFDMLRRQVINKKSLVIVPIVLALALAGIFLPAREVGTSDVTESLKHHNTLAHTQ